MDRRLSVGLLEERREGSDACLVGHAGYQER
jgi:hypothetical protein